MKIIKSIILADDNFKKVNEGDKVKIITHNGEMVVNVVKIDELSIKVSVTNIITKSIRYENILLLEVM